MPVDASAVGRTVGIDTEYKDSRDGNVAFLPQRIAVFAHGSSDAVYDDEKWEATGAGTAGSRYGFGSEAHLVLRELLPVNGDGVGTIAVTVYPLSDAGGAAAAAGDITPSGTATAAGSYRVRVSGILSLAFVIAAGVLTGAALTAACVAMGDAIEGVLEMPVKVTYDYGTVTALAGTNTGNGTCTVLSVDGTPRPGVYSLVCNTAVADGGVFTLTDPDGVEIADDITMTPGAGGATVINEGDLEFTLTDGVTNFIVGDSFAITVPATAVNQVCKWKGETGNDLYLEVLPTEELGVTFTITQPTGGLVNPSITAALGQVGEVWETMVLNGLNLDDTDILDEFQEFGEGRWGALVHKPLVVFTGNTLVDVEDATAVSDARRTDRVNAQLVAPGSPNLPCVVAARQLARIAKLANNNPPHDYGSQRATGLVPGTDGEQWDNAVRDQAVKAGSSTIRVKDRVVNICDVVTFYRPEGEEPPGYRYVVDIVKLQNCTYNVALLFENEEWDGAPLVPDAQVVTNPTAKKPRMAKAEIASLADSLGEQAIVSDPEATKKKTTAAINGSNPKRLDLRIPWQVSGNANIIDAVQEFSFFFGG